MKKDRIPPIQSRHKAWLLTFLDLMMLMLTFFIMVYAMRTPSPDIFIPSSSLFETERTKQFENNWAPRRGVHLNYLEQILIQKIGTPDGWFFEKNDQTLILAIPSNIFENTEKRILNAPDETRLLTLGETLNNISNEIVLIVDKQDLLLAAAIANTLKSGGLINEPAILTTLRPQKAFLQIVIYPGIKGEIQ